MARYLTYMELCDRASRPIIGKITDDEAVIRNMDKAIMDMGLSINEDYVSRHYEQKQRFYDEIVSYLMNSCYDLDTAISVMVRFHPEAFIGEIDLTDEYAEEIMYTTKQLKFILDGAKLRGYVMQGRMATRFVPNRRKVLDQYLMKFIPHIVYNDQLQNYEIQLMSGEYFRTNENLPYGQSKYFIDALMVARDFLQTISETKDHIDEHPEDFE